jgi:hypothetical protein
MQLSELFLNRWLFREKQTVETLGADYVSSNVADAPSTAVASGNTVIDINSNAMTINGSQIAPGIADYGWTQTCAFTSTNLNTVTWGAGSFIAANGATYTIAGGTTGVISGKKYVYLDTNVSVTSYQVSANNDTYASIGIGKVLIAVCQNAAVASPQPNATYNLVQASQIVADNILANTIGANKMNVGQLSAITADMGLITAGNIFVTSGGNTIAFTPLGVNAIYSGPTGSPTFFVTPAGALTATNAYITGNIVGSTITGGLFQTTASGSSNRIAIDGPTNEIDFYTNGIFAGYIAPYGSDATNRGIAINAGGGGLIFAAQLGGVSRAYIGNAGSAEIDIQGATLWILGTTNVDGSFQTTTTGAHISVAGNAFLRMKSMTGATASGLAGAQNGAMYYRSDDNTVRVMVGGSFTNVKSAIVPTSKGFRALYCAESPEVWFFDFCTGTRTEDIDPLFLEVTVPPYHFIMCEGGEYQVWGKRKGHEEKRFEAKTGKEFVANERFLSMNKPSYQFN